MDEVCELHEVQPLALPRLLPAARGVRLDQAYLAVEQQVVSRRPAWERLGRDAVQLVKHNERREGDRIVEDAGLVRGASDGNRISRHLDRVEASLWGRGLAGDRGTKIKSLKMQVWYAEWATAGNESRITSIEYKPACGGWPEGRGYGGGGGVSRSDRGGRKRQREADLRWREGTRVRAVPSVDYFDGRLVPL
eukprot:scaffold8881_cov95-Isochrysis_galbana.AAC.2